MVGKLRGSIHRYAVMTMSCFVLMIGFSSFIRDPADKVRFFEAYSDITGSGKEGITAYSLFIKYLI